MTERVTFKVGTDAPFTGCRYRTVKEAKACVRRTLERNTNAVVHIWRCNVLYGTYKFDKDLGSIVGVRNE